MKKLLTALMGAGVLLAASQAGATPEDDRNSLVKFYQSKYPNIPLENYVYGALAFEPDAKAQYDSIMEFPPFETDLDKARKMWETPFKNGKTYADCLPNGGKNVAGTYPRFDDKMGKVVTLEMELNACRKANGEEEYKYGDPKTMGLVTAYMRTLSDGMLMNIKVEGPAATAAYEAGKTHFYKRRGQFSFACASCHVQNGGNKLRSELLSPAVGQSVHWPVFRQGTDLTTLQKRYAGCNKQVRAVSFPLGSEEYNNLEYFHSYISNGLPLKASVFRK